MKVEIFCAVLADTIRICIFMPPVLFQLISVYVLLLIKNEINAYIVFHMLTVPDPALGVIGPRQGGGG